MTYLYITLSVVAVLAALVVLLGLRMDREYQRGIIFRLGRFQSVRGPGLYWVIPFVNQKVRVDIRTRTVYIEARETVASDRVTIRVNAVPVMACSRSIPVFALWIVTSLICTTGIAAEQNTPKHPGSPAVVLKLPPGPNNPRNSEGDLIRLRDGRVMLVYTHFDSGAEDHSGAYLAARFSSDGGRTWTSTETKVVANEGTWNVMSVSLLRLRSGKIGLFYVRKNSLKDCRPYMRLSDDEGQTWSDPVLCIPDKVGYYVLNNDRAVQLSNGRLILPVALHNRPGDARPDWNGIVMCYFSDDQGKTWRRSKSQLIARGGSGKRLIAQEPGVIPMKSGRLMLFCRSNAGCQLVAFSEDHGDTWSELKTSSIISPVSPASIERVPKTGDWILVWNNHKHVKPPYTGKRTPYNVAISRDEGKTWDPIKTLANDPNGWYCYTAIEFVDDHVLLAHCAGDRRQNNGLAESHVTRFSLDWLYR